MFKTISAALLRLPFCAGRGWQREAAPCTPCVRERREFWNANARMGRHHHSILPSPPSQAYRSSPRCAAA
jgi:hypothetical protein